MTYHSFSRKEWWSVDTIYIYTCHFEKTDNLLGIFGFFSGNLTGSNFSRLAQRAMPGLLCPKKIDVLNQ